MHVLYHTSICNSVPTTTPTTLTTPEVPIYCQDQRVLNYNTTLSEEFVVLGNDQFGGLTANAAMALNGSPDPDGYGLNSYDGGIKILIKLTEICVRAEVVRFSFTLRGAANYTVRVGLSMPIYVSHMLFRSVYSQEKSSPHSTHPSKDFGTIICCCCRTMRPPAQMLSLLMSVHLKVGAMWEMMWRFQLRRQLG